MAGSKSNWLEDAVLDSILGKSSTLLSTGVVAATQYVSLWNSTITDAWTSTSTGECAGSTYARVAVTNSSANWTNSTNGSVQNKTVIEFTTAAGSDWGTVKAFAIHDGNSTTTGNIYYWGDLTANQTIATGNTVQFSTGAIVITED
jgi:hypothetical protein